MTDYGKCVWIAVTGVIRPFARHARVVMMDVYRTSKVCAKRHNGLMEYNADRHSSCSNPACDHTGTATQTVQRILHACQSTWHATELVKDGCPGTVKC
jgi:predicted ABC-class ATPase